jgi:O-antigen/teichoic acid export membrane protein
LSDWVVNLLYGQEYAQAGPVLALHVWAGMFVAIGVASGNWLLTENLIMLSFWRTFSGMALNILLNFLWIPTYGIQGAAFATISSQSVAVYFFDFFNQKTKKTFWMKTKSFFIFNLFARKKFYA